MNEDQLRGELMDFLQDMKNNEAKILSAATYADQSDRGRHYQAAAEYGAARGEALDLLLRFEGWEYEEEY